jgi:hypothetical protein
MSKKNEHTWFNRYMCGISPNMSPYRFDDKTFDTQQHVAYMLNRTQSMFTWEGLPDTVSERALELYLQTHGNACFAEHDGNLYVFIGGLGGEPDAYYMPTIYTVANPALRYSATLKIDEDCIVIPNDSLYIGLLPLFTRYATQITETELSLNLATINTRIYDMISASDDRTKASAEKYLEDVANGKLGVIAESAFLEGLKSQPYGSVGNNSLTNLIELMQYQKASWFNELGLNANYNMKRESINSGESQLNDDALIPLVDDMLRQRELGAKKVNDMFKTNITVKLASAWEDNQQELDAEQNAIEDMAEPKKGGEDK